MTKPVEPTQQHHEPRQRALRGAPGFQVGLLAAAATVVVVGLVAWLAFGGDGNPGKHAAGEPVSPTDTLGPVRTGPLGSPPTTTKHAKRDKSSNSLPVYTPSGSQNPILPANQLPGVSGPDPVVVCPAATVTVSTADELTQALAAAQPGTVIQLADGTYSGQFTGTAAGTATQPVFVCGGPGAVLDRGDTSANGYVFHLQNASYWRLSGFTVQNGQKGVVLDHTDHSIVEKLTAHHFGDEAIHLREFSVDNLVLDNTVQDTGLLKAKFGEGVYIGTAQSNWCTYTAC
jgi:hypothetical protein